MLIKGGQEALRERERERMEYIRRQSIYSFFRLLKGEGDREISHLKIGSPVQKFEGGGAKNRQR